MQLKIYPSFFVNFITGSADVFCLNLSIVVICETLSL